MEVQNSSIIVSRMCSSLDGCEYCAFLTSRSDVSVEAFFTDVSDVMSYHACQCEFYAFLTSRSDVSVEPFHRW